MGAGVNHKRGNANLFFWPFPRKLDEIEKEKMDQVVGASLASLFYPPTLNHRRDSNSSND